jgi:hypothetical protein
MVATLAVGLEITEATARTAGVRVGSPIWYAQVLAGGSAGGDASAVALYNAHKTFARDAEIAAGADPQAVFTIAAFPRTPYADGIMRLSTYFAGTPATRAKEFGPASRRYADLMTLDSFFAPNRERHTWEDMIKDRVVILNHGAAGEGTVPLPQGGVDKMASMILGQLKAAVPRVCQGWEDKGMSLRLFVDELYKVCRDDESLLTWWRDEAGKFGAWIAFFTQAGRQFSQPAIDCLIEFPTFIWLQPGEATSAIKLACDQLDVRELGVWNEIVPNLEKYTGILTTTVAGRKVPPCWVEFAGLSFKSAAERAAILKEMSGR